MKFLVAFSAVLAVAVARPGIITPIQHQYHAQDELGQYTYGYSGGPSAKVETKTADGVTRGAYSYVDSNGLVQNVNYVADPVNGFRVAATNLPVAPAAPAVVAPVAAVTAPVAAIAAPVAAVAPAVVAPVVDTPEVAVARAEHLAIKAAADAKAYSAAAVVAPVVTVGAPLPIADTPEVAIEKANHLATLAHAKATIVDDSLVTDDGSYKVNPLEDDGEYKGEAAQVAVVDSAVGPVAAVVSDDTAHLYDDGSYKQNPLEDDGSYKGEIAVVGTNYINTLTPARLSYVSQPLAYAAPAVSRYAVATPAVHAAVTYKSVVPAVVPATHSQFHAQDELGQYQYGYVAPLSSKHEARSADGVTRGGYSYIDANGIVQTVNYVSDSVNGFRVAATNLPVAPQ